ncbi:MAG: single-stranded DNA-binding protein [Actinomycetota bacterium]
MRYTSGGKAVLNFRVAVDAAGKSSNDAGFFDCAAWGDLGENVAESVAKGQRVIVTGQLKQRSFESNGQARTVTEILVEDAGPSLLWARVTATKRVTAAATAS